MRPTRRLLGAALCVVASVAACGNDSNSGSSPSSSAATATDNGATLDFVALLNTLYPN